MLLKIKNLKLKTIIGIYDWEQDLLRDIIINAQITLQSNKVLETSNLEDSLDYEEITNKIKDLTKNKFSLVEDLANKIADIIMSYHNVAKTSVEVDKLGAVNDLESFSVTINKEK